MDLIGLANEITILKKDIDLLQSTIKDKKIRLNELKDILDTWLDKIGRKEVTHNDQVLYKRIQPKPERLTKEEKEEKKTEILQSLGIRDCKLVLDKLKNAEKGELRENSQIVIESKKKYEQRIERERRKSRK